MQFDTTITPLQFNIAVSEEDNHLEFVVVSGTLLNMGGGQALPVPIGIYRLPFPTKESAKEFHTQLGKAIEAMPDDTPQSDIMIANSIGQVNDLAKQMDKIIVK
jgi:hypothetical protein